MPRVTFAEMKLRARQARFVAPGYDAPGRVFFVCGLPQADQDKIAAQLETQAQRCRTTHGATCLCIAQHATRTSERTMLVLHDVR